MIGKNTLKKYGYASITDYFEYIVDSQVNGNFFQVKELFKKLDNEQKNDFFKWLKSNEVSFNFSELYEVDF